MRIYFIEICPIFFSCIEKRRNFLLARIEQLSNKLMNKLFPESIQPKKIFVVIQLRGQLLN